MFYRVVHGTKLVNMSMSRADIDTITLWCRSAETAELRGDHVEPEVTGRHIDLVVVAAPDAESGDRTRTPIARLRFMGQTGLWTLYWRDSDGAFNVYRNFPSVRSVTEILEFLAVDPDPIFWA